MTHINDYLNKIHLWDCMDILRQLPDKSVDLVLTDPPYILNNTWGGRKNDFGTRKLVKEHHIDFISNDFDFEPVFNEFIRICKTPNIMIFCSNAQVSRTMAFFENLGYSVTLLTWDKPNPIPLSWNKFISNLEFIVYAKGKGVYWNNDLPINKKKKSFYYAAPQSRIHPTEKPIELIADLIELVSRSGDIVLDCFSGSGTTAVACHNLGRQFICVEKDPEYHAASVKRLEQAQKNQFLF